MKAEDLYRIEAITSLQLSPDGEHVVYAQQRVDKGSEKKYQNLWIAPTGKDTPRQFTYGDQSDTNPKWSPDGKTIAFLSNRGDGQKMQIYLIPFGGGEARPLTEMKGFFGGFEWSPDGKQLLVGFSKMDEEAAERMADEKKKKLGVVARHFTRVHWKFDGAGYLPKEQQHIWLVNAKTGKDTQLTDHETYSEFGARFSPDGKKIAFFSNRSEDIDRTIFGTELYVMDAKVNAKMKMIPTREGAKDMAAWSPDGKAIAYLGSPGTGYWWEGSKLYTVPANGKGELTCLTEALDFHIGTATSQDVSEAAAVAPVWSSDGGKIYVQVCEHGNVYLREVDVETREVTAVIEDKGVVGHWNFDAEQKKLAYYWGMVDDPNQVRVLDLEKESTKQLTKLNAWIKRLDLGTVEEVWFTGEDKNDLHGWILKPPGFRNGKKYPSILEIHGGPMFQYGNHFMHEFYYLAAQGFVVYYSNPRGGFGYGNKHTTAIINAFGDRDYADVMAWTDYIEEMPYIDTERMGVTGGSYGGYMTAWIIGKTNRFQAAVAQRAVTNWVSMLGSSDANWRFESWMGNMLPWQGEKQLLNIWRQSPMSLMGEHVKTPTMVIHSEMDQRVEQEQGEQLFVALKTLGVDTELVLYPDSPHGLSRVGRVDRRIDRLNSILRWMKTYLK